MNKDEKEMTYENHESPYLRQSCSSLRLQIQYTYYFLGL